MEVFGPKMAPKMIRFVFHDAGDFRNLETLDGLSVSDGYTGLDGCLHTQRDHIGATDSWRMRGDDEDGG